MSLWFKFAIPWWLLMLSIYSYSHWPSLTICMSSLEKMFSSSIQFSHILLFATPWTAAHQASLSITNSQSLLKLMSIEAVIPFNHPILYHPLLLLPSISPGLLPIFKLSYFWCLVIWDDYVFWILTSYWL